MIDDYFRPVFLIRFLISCAETHYGKTFEELCRAHIQAFAKGAEKFALSTKLTERVGKWQAKLAPILEDEERKASFDIHRYSEMLIENAKDSMQLGKRKSDSSIPSSTAVEFGAVTKGCTKSDVCRFFLASLSLANAGNLKIDRDHQAGAYRFEVHSFKLEKPMETYRAPSVSS